MNESRNIYLLWKVTFFVLCDNSVIVLDWKVLNGVLRFFVLFYIPIVHFLSQITVLSGVIGVSTFCYS